MPRPALSAAATNLAVVALTVVLGAGVVVALLAARQRSSGATDAIPAAAADLRPRTDRLIAGLQDRLQRQPRDAEAHAELGQLYLQKVRESGDPAYYPRAEAVLRQAFTLDPDSPATLVGLGSLAMARHQFGEALAWGERAVPLAPYTPAAYGLLADAQTELGQYAEALATLQRMVDLRPDLSAYARIAYARELHGDLQGAIAAMDMAVRAGPPGRESTAWVRVQLGHLDFAVGELDAAEAQYRAALGEFPDYIHALAGLGRVAAAREDYQSAIDAYTRATATIPMPEYLVALADVYQAAGRTDDVRRVHELIGAIQRLYTANGVDTDLEMAVFDLDHDRDVHGALARLEALSASRPSIKVDDALGWALYKAGSCQDARNAMQRAFRLGTQDSLMFFHVGMVESCLGNPEAAEGWLARALALNPRFSVLYAERASQALAEMQTPMHAAASGRTS